jgi:hypothetical protein
MTPPNRGETGVSVGEMPADQAVPAGASSAKARLPGTRKHRGLSPSEVAAEYRKLGDRLLARLADPAMRAERRGEQIVLVRAGRAVSLAAGMPTGVLAHLLEAGAVRCETRAGKAAFVITDAGQSRLARGAAIEAPYASQHREMAVQVMDVEGARQTVQVNLREDPLEVFRRGRHLAHFVGPAELEAGERLQRDFVIARTMPQVTANWSRLVVDGAGYNPGLSMPEVVIEARRRVEKALGAVGPDFSGILVDMLAFSKGIASLERENALPLRSGKVAFAFALRHLARHYGLGNAASGARRSNLVHWGAEDYRPRIGAA